MTEKWGMCAILMLCLLLAVGCRSRHPELKPEKTPEQLVEPPQEGRYESSAYPKAAYDKLVDPMRNAWNDRNAAGVMPTRGGMGAAGMGGMR
ncbi:MAG: hypothetical protein HYR84_05655 [Planctomycetes bacterium]|nr:hypothetical protein [Planctomycetota bacterium]